MMLKALNLACVRDERVLFSSLSFDVDPGQIVQIAGCNGAGKTSLLRILIGLARPAEGRVYWQGYPLAHERDNFHRQLLWYGHQPGVKNALSAEENLEFYHSATRRKDRWAALRACGLTGYEDVPVGQMSAGQQRRVTLARLWLSDARLWVLDEPFTALDAEGIAQLTLRLEAHASNGGLVILTTHQPLRPLNVELRSIDLSKYLPENEARL